MTKQEHELMSLMFARVYQSVGILVDALKSREIWTNDDVKAFAHAAHADEQKIRFYVRQAMNDYLVCAAQSGVITGLEKQPPSS